MVQLGQQSEADADSEFFFSAGDSEHEGDASAQLALVEARVELDELRRSLVEAKADQSAARLEQKCEREMAARAAARHEDVVKKLRREVDAVRELLEGEVVRAEDEAHAAMEAATARERSLQAELNQARTTTETAAASTLQRVFNKRWTRVLQERYYTATARAEAAEVEHAKLKDELEESQRALQSSAARTLQRALVPKMHLAVRAAAGDSAAMDQLREERRLADVRQLEKDQVCERARGRSPRAVPPIPFRCPANRHLGRHRPPGQCVRRARVRASCTCAFACVPACPRGFDALPAPSPCSLSTSSSTTLSSSCCCCCIARPHPLVHRSHATRSRQAELRTALNESRRRAARLDKRLAQTEGGGMIVANAVRQALAAELDAVEKEVRGGARRSGAGGKQRSQRAGWGDGGRAPPIPRRAVFSLIQP